MRDTRRALPPLPSMVAMNANDTCHTRTVASASEKDRISRPSGDSDTAVTLALCP
jgi:hypothetical protein